MSAKVKKGIAIVSQAVDYDSKKQYKEALALYNDAIQCFEEALAGEHQWVFVIVESFCTVLDDSKPIKKTTRQKKREYEQRRDELKVRSSVFNFRLTFFVICRYW